MAKVIRAAGHWVCSPKVGAYLTDDHFLTRIDQKSLKWLLQQKINTSSTILVVQTYGV